MDLTTRIRRRQRSGDDSQLVLDYDAISPVAHLREPTGRGSVLERLLDYVDPVFDDRLPRNAYVWGPPGTGKSAVVTALFARLGRLRSLSGSVIHTSTRGGTGVTPDLVSVDARHADSDFGLYRAILDAVLEEFVPEHGVSTETLHARLSEYLAPYDRRILVALDHVGEPDARRLVELASALDTVPDSLSWVAVGRASPSTLPEAVRPPDRIEVPAYREHALVDILTARASAGLARRAVEHEQLRQIASWADGNAHDALSALFAAAHAADSAGASRVRERDLWDGMNAVPRPSVSLGRVLARPGSRQQVLRRLVTLGEEGTSVSAAADAIAGSPAVDLSAGTVQRLIYELANNGIVERVASDRSNGAGRPPSRLEPQFPTAVFRQLYDIQPSSIAEA